MNARARAVMEGVQAELSGIRSLLKESLDSQASPDDTVTGDFVSIHIDLDNMLINHRNNGLEFDPSVIITRAQAFGTVRYAMMFCDFSQGTPELNRIAEKAYEAGFDFRHCPKITAVERRRKDTVDSVMIQDMDNVLARYPEINTFLLGTGDRDFIPALHSIRRAGKRVVALTGLETTNLARSADESVSSVGDVVLAITFAEMYACSLTDEKDVAKLEEKFPGFMKLLHAVISKLQLMHNYDKMSSMKNFVANRLKESGFNCTKDDIRKILEWLSAEKQSVLISKKTDDSTSYMLRKDHPFVSFATS